MKKIFVLILTTVSLAAFAQVDRTKAPAPAPAPAIKVGQPATFTLPNGLKVFVVQNTKLPRVSATLTIDRDPIIEGNKAGLTGMTGELLRRGTSTMNKAALDEAIDFLGANISASSTSVNGTSLKTNFTKVMKLMADIALRPSFSSEELEKIRKQSLSNLAQQKDDPASIASNVVSKVVYGKDHPYGEIETEESVKNVTVSDIKQYYNTYWKPNIAYLIFVGDITPADAKKLAEENFGAWKRGDVPKQVYTSPKAPAKTFIALVDRPASVQSLINIVTPIELKPGSADFIPSSLMNSILGDGSSGRLFMNLREKHGFTYGAYSSISSDKLIGNFTADASVRNEKTDSAIGQFLYEFNRLRNEAINNDDISLMKNQKSGSFARSLENPATIANFALNTARYNLPATYYQDYLKNMAAVTPDQLKQMADKYVVPDHLAIVVVGSAKDIGKSLEKYGEVKYYDIYGNEKAAPTEKKMDASVTPESILKKSVAALGGEAAIAAIKDIQMNGTASIMGQTITVSQKNVIPGAFVSSASVSGMVVQKQMVKNGAYSVSQQGTDMPVGDDDKEELDEKAAFFADAFLLKQTGNTYTLKGIEQVNGKDAYVLAVKTAKGREFTNYYDVASGLKVKESSEKDAGPMGKLNIQTYISDYKTFNGVQIATHVLVDLGQFKQDITFNEVKVNQGLKAEDIK